MSVAAISPLVAAVRAARTLAERAQADPLQFIRWTPPQRDWLRLAAPRKLLRAGNQLGKSVAGLSEVIYRASGRHPFLAVREPPIEAWIVCTTWSQSVAIMRKFHDLCPPGVIDERRTSRFNVRAGFGKDNPCVVFRSGSLVRFRTTNQGPEAFAGATVDVVLIDEPTEEEIYRELDRRVMRRAGVLLLTLTPINADCTWLHALVDAGIIEEVHARLTPENLTPIGAAGPLRLLDGTPMDAEWIAAQWRATPASYAQVILDGEWETRPEGVVFDCFERARHVSAEGRLDAGRGQILHLLGIDYAGIDRETGQCATLWQGQTSADDRGHPREALIAVDEVVLSGISTNRQFAQDLLRMLDRHGLRWRDIDLVHGDNPVTMGDRMIKRSNVQTMEAVARELRLPQASLAPRIRNAKDGQASSGAVDAGVRYLYERIGSGDVIVRPECQRLAWALETWDGGRLHPAKDVIDAARYALKPYIFPARTYRPVAVRIG